MTARVRPPSVQEALTLDELGTSILTDSDAWFAFVEVLNGWLPKSLASLLTGWGFPPERALAIVQDLLAIGSPTREKQQERKRGALEAYVTWAGALSEYRRTYGADALAEPWPYFLLMMSKLSRLQALESMRYVRNHRIASNPNRDIEEGIRETAGIRKRRLTEEEQATEFNRMTQGYQALLAGKPLHRES